MCLRTHIYSLDRYWEACGEHIVHKTMQEGWRDAIDTAPKRWWYPCGILAPGISVPDGCEMPLPLDKCNACAYKQRDIAVEAETRQKEDRRLLLSYNERQDFARSACDRFYAVYSPGASPPVTCWICSIRLLRFAWIRAVVCTATGA